MSELTLALKIIKEYCGEQSSDNCDECPLYPVCYEELEPMYLDIPEPTPEPAERPRIDWLRMLPDIDVARAIISTIDDGLCAICSMDMHTCNGRCKDGVCSWYCKAISLEQFRKEVELDE